MTALDITRFFDRDVVVRRLRTTTGDKKAYSATATVDGHIQEMDGQARQQQGIVEARAWQAWFDLDDDVDEGDELTDELGNRYHVISVTRKDYGTNQHLEVIMTEKTA